MVSMAATAKIAVLLAVAALFTAAGADDQQPAKEGACWQCYSNCMHKCDGYPDAPVRSANRTQPATHIAVDDGAAAASVDPVNDTDPTTATVHSTDGAVGPVGDSYDDKGDDDKGDDEDEDEDDDADDKDKDQDKGKGKDDDDDDDNDKGDKNDDDDSRGGNNGKNYFTCKKTCIVDCYKDLPPVCYKMCIAETCLTLPPYKQGDCFKACGMKCFHKHPGPKPGPKPKPPSPKPMPPPKPPSPKPMPPPKPTPPKPTPTPTPPKPAPPGSKPKPPCPPKSKRKPKPCPSKPAPPKPKPPCPPAATSSSNINNNN